MSKKIIEKVQGHPAIDGAGVHLVRVLGRDTLESFDPFLMLDSFDSKNPEDYIKGFPLHPHRGIETITYLAKGKIQHKDSLGNEGFIGEGDVQWMTAGSGIMHEEMPQPADRMLGLQFWLNLPKVEKMTKPKYFDILNKDIPIVEEDGTKVHVISGEYKGTKGITPHHIPATFFDIELEDGKEVTFDSPNEETCFVFTLEGEAIIAGEKVKEKTACLMKDGDSVTVKGVEGGTRLIVAQAKPLHEPIKWAGPIVMNTQEELIQASIDLRNGTFIKDEPIDA